MISPCKTPRVCLRRRHPTCSIDDLGLTQYDIFGMGNNDISLSRHFFKISRRMNCMDSKPKDAGFSKPPVMLVLMTFPSIVHNKLVKRLCCWLTWLTQLIQI